MIQTPSLQNRCYLAVTTITSIGVLSGLEYCSPLLAILLLAPVVNVLIEKIYCHTTETCK